LSSCQCSTGVSVFWGVPESIFVLSWCPFMFKLCLSPCETIINTDNILIESEIWDFVCLTLQMIWLLSFHPVQFVFELFFSDCKTFERGFDIVINTEIWNKVVHWVVWWTFWLFVLSATSARADWVRL